MVAGKFNGVRYFPIVSGEDASTQDQRRFGQCPNCGVQLEPDSMYCPGCGQENIDKNVSLSTLFVDFLGDFFTFDSRFFRSLVPFLFKPGVMTRNYLAGKRETYLPPLRILIFLCIILLTLLSRIASTRDWDTGFQGNSPITLSGLEQTDSVAQSEDSISEFLGRDVITAMDEGVQSSVGDSILSELFGIEPGLAIADTLFVGPNGDTVLVPQATGSMPDDFWAALSNGSEEMASLTEAGMSPAEIADSLTSEGYWQHRAVMQSAKIYQSGGEGMVSFMISNGIIIVLLAVFFLAALFKLFYIRHSRHYVEHVIFSLHMHAALVFIFIIMAAVFLISGKVPLFLILALTPYYLLSMRNVYQQSWIRTVAKFLITTFIYLTFFLPVFFLITVIVSFLFF